MDTKQLNKVREMRGVRMGDGSAGRAGSPNGGKKLTPLEGGSFTGYGDVGRACDRWLMERDPEWRRMRERQIKADFLRHGRRLAAADAAEKKEEEDAI